MNYTDHGKRERLGTMLPKFALAKGHGTDELYPAEGDFFTVVQADKANKGIGSGGEKKKTAATKTPKKRTAPGDDHDDYFNYAPLIASPAPPPRRSPNALPQRWFRRA